jgi:hypothetical protein
VLLGSTALLPTRPTIVLKAGSRGFGNASPPKNEMKITNPHGDGGYVLLIFLSRVFIENKKTIS